MTRDSKSTRSLPRQAAESGGDADAVIEALYRALEPPASDVVGPHRRPGRREARHGHVVRTLWPGQAGTLGLARRFGDRLICVRYRRDATGLERSTTVELTIDRGPVRSRASDRREFTIRVSRSEHELQAKIKAHGGRWDPEQRLWRLRGRAVKALELYDRARPK